MHINTNTEHTYKSYMITQPQKQFTDDTRFSQLKITFI